MADFLTPDKLEALRKESPEIQKQVLDKYFPTLKQESPEIQKQVHEKYGLLTSSPIALTTRDEILKGEISKMSGPQKFFAGVGSGMYEFAKGIQQKGAQLGEKVGAVSPETVKRITSEGEETRGMFKPLMKESGAAKTGKFVGELAPTLLVPGGAGGTALMRAGTAALSGSALGATRFTGEGESTAKNALIGGLTAGGTSLALSGAGKVINALRGNVPETATQSLAKSKGISTTLGEDIGNVQLQKAETLLEKVPITGIRKFREKQLESADNAAKTFLGKYIADPTNATIEGNRAFSSNLFNQMKQVVEPVKDVPIFANETSKKANELLNRYPDLFKKFQDTTRENIIKNVAKGATPVMTTGQDALITAAKKSNVKFDDMWTLRDGLGEMIGQAKSKLRAGEVDRTTISHLNSLYKAVNDDIDKWASSVGKPEIRTAINAANEAYKKYVVKYSLLQKAYDASAGISSAKEIFSPKTFSTSLKKIISKDKEYGTFKPAEIEEMTGLANIMQVVKRAGQYAENPPTGNRMIDAALTGGGVVGAATQLAVTAKTAGTVAATTSIMKFLTTTTAGKNIVRAASKVEPTSIGMQRIFDKIYQLIPRMPESFYRNDINFPSLTSTAEAGTLTDYSRGATSKRQQALEEAASYEIPQARPASERVSQAPATSRAPMNKSEQAAYAAETERLRQELERRKQAEKGGGKKMKSYIPVKMIRVQTADGEELRYVDNKGKIYESDPNE